jgi:cell wall-associated NlpC family hydrolase
MGVDCSGFVQVVFKMLGKKLKRDAWMQAEQGEKVDQLEAARKGDLAFFSNDNGKIIHVGILLSNDSIIHASGKVRIDPIDHLGIIHSGNGKRTHRLSAIRRYF